MKFLRAAHELGEEMEKLELRLKEGTVQVEGEEVEESRRRIQELYLQVCNIGRNLKEGMETAEDGKVKAAVKTKEGGTEMPAEGNQKEGDGFCHVVERFLERFTHR